MAHETAVFRNPYTSSSLDSLFMDSSVTNTIPVKILRQKKNIFSLYYRKNITCLSVGLLSIGQVFRVSCETV